MIPKAYITEWKKFAPWNSDHQVEQDLIIERSLVEIFSCNELKEKLSFRGGTALHKLYLEPQVRYSEDIDLVQTKPGKIGGMLDLLRECMSFLGTGKYEASEDSVKLIYRYDSEFEPVIKTKLKIEINTREHFSVFGFNYIEHEIINEWFSGKCNISTYSLEELLSTKLRALYQRKKGRDLFDIWYAYNKVNINTEKVIKGFREYLKKEGLNIKREEYLNNMDEKIKDSEFLGDTTALLKTDIDYNHLKAWEYVKDEIVNKI